MENCRRRSFASGRAFGVCRGPLWQLTAAAQLSHSGGRMWLNTPAPRTQCAVPFTVSTTGKVWGGCWLMEQPGSLPARKETRRPVCLRARVTRSNENCAMAQKRGATDSRAISEGLNPRCVAASLLPFAAAGADDEARIGKHRLNSGRCRAESANSLGAHIDGGAAREGTGFAAPMFAQLSLRQKLAVVRRRIAYMQKRGRNERKNYNYVTAADLAGAPWAIFPPSSASS